MCMTCVFTLIFRYFSKGFKNHISLWSEMPNHIKKLNLGLYCLDMRFWHTNGLLRHQRSSKNYKRPMKIMKAKSKTRGWPKTKFQIFFTFLGSLEVFYCMISIFLSFEVIKAKKAAVVAGAAFLFLWKFMVSKLLL